MAHMPPQIYARLYFDYRPGVRLREKIRRVTEGKKGSFENFREKSFLIYYSIK